MELASEERVTALDPVFGQMGIAAGRHIWSIPQLSMREKTFLCLVADVCHPHLALPFELHMEMGMKQGVTTEDFRECLRHLGPYAGYTACASAFERLLEIAQHLGMQYPTPADHSEVRTGATLGYPPPLASELRKLDAPFAEYVEQQAKQVWSRPGLSQRERAMISLAVDVLYQTLDEPFRAHVDLALRAGASREDVRAVVRFVAEFGLAKAWCALLALTAYFAEVDTVQQETSQSKQVTGEVEVTDYQTHVITPADESGISLIETPLTETFTGGLVGTGLADHLRVVRADGSETSTGVERFSGSLDGRAGSYTLTDTAFKDTAGVVHGSFEVVQGSGTGQLIGLCGRGDFTAQGRHSSYTFTYWFTS
jgi:4-carboxymuconolactone decarboxylase